ncbi:unnamed protein product [marine sediment metagenome]|uniref:Uncharacterized protein n=1 Tax=marine sediment metagenome TaxID=412755 RepID=X1EXA6_9ZZZZ
MARIIADTNAIYLLVNFFISKNTSGMISIPDSALRNLCANSLSPNNNIGMILR